MIIATISAGSVEYGIAYAQVSIEDLIAQLQQARKEGATHLVGLSGNYRGAQYVKLGEVNLQDDSGDQG